MSNHGLGTDIVARFTGNFKDGQLYHQLIDCGFEPHAILPGTIKPSQAKMPSSLFTKVQSSGGEIEVMDEVYRIPPSTRSAEDPAPDQEFTPEQDEAHKELLTLESLDLSPHALKLAREHDLDPVALYDTFGDGPIMKGDVSQFIQSLE